MPPDRHQALELHRNLRVFALELHDEDGRCPCGIARLHGRLGRVHRKAVHDLHGTRQQARLDYPRHGVASGLEARIGGEHRAVSSRPGHQAQRDLERDPEQAFRSDEQAPEIGARLLEAVTPERCDGPVT